MENSTFKRSNSKNLHSLDKNQKSKFEIENNNHNNHPKN